MAGVTAHGQDQRGHVEAAQRRAIGQIAGGRAAPEVLDLGLRTCEVRLADASVLVHAPGPATVAVRGEIERIGPVRALAAPNVLHHLLLGDTAAAWPQARVLAAAGLRGKRPDLRIDEELGEKPPALWASDLDQALVNGAPSLGEVVSLQRANGAWDRFGPSHLFRYAIPNDGCALRGSPDRMLAWGFDRVSVAHGAVLAPRARGAAPGVRLVALECGRETRARRDRGADSRFARGRSARAADRHRGAYAASTARSSSSTRRARS